MALSNPPVIPGQILTVKNLHGVSRTKTKKNYAVEIRAAMGWTLDLTISTLRVG